MFRRIILSMLSLSTLFTVPNAAPIIEFDTKVYQCDTAVEDRTVKLKAIFIVKNAGDAPLKIEKVRPGCGCTNVQFDPVIKPGKSSKISAEVNIKGYKAGALSKYLIVTSNAVNENDARLLINATIVGIVEVSDYNLNFGGRDTTKTRTLTLVSKKHDLNVTDVYLKQSELHMPVGYQWRPLDSLRADGARYFKLDLTPPAVTTSTSGDIVIKTNHPEKPELKIQISIAARR
jgi:hypothetical protein